MPTIITAGGGAARGFGQFNGTVPQILGTQTILVNLWVFGQAGTATGWNDWYAVVSQSGGLSFTITGACCDTGYTAGYYSTSGHTNAPAGYIYTQNQHIAPANLFVNGYNSGYIAYFSGGRDTLGFRTVTVWNGSTLAIQCWSSGKNATWAEQLTATIYPQIYFA